MAFQRIAALALLCAACSESTPGRKLASGLARGLIAREGEVAFLLAARRPEDPGVPEDLLTGDLWLDDRKVGSGVSSGWLGGRIMSTLWADTSFTLDPSYSNVSRSALL